MPKHNLKDYTFLLSPLSIYCFIRSNICEALFCITEEPTQGDRRLLLVSASPPPGFPAGSSPQARQSTLGRTTTVPPSGPLCPPSSNCLIGIVKLQLLN